jgi:hypothetical protein
MSDQWCHPIRIRGAYSLWRSSLGRGTAQADIDCSLDAPAGRHLSSGRSNSFDRWWLSGRLQESRIARCRGWESQRRVQGRRGLSTRAEACLSHWFTTKIITTNCRMRHGKSHCCAHTHLSAVGIWCGRKRPPSAARPLRTTVSNDNLDMLARRCGYCLAGRNTNIVIAASGGQIDLRLGMSLVLYAVGHLFATFTALMFVWRCNQLPLRSEVGRFWQQSPEDKSAGRNRIDFEQSLAPIGRALLSIKLAGASVYRIYHLPM